MRSPDARHDPELSVVVVVYNMAREAPRTLFSLSSEYQRRIDPESYEVVVVDNGSTEPLGRERVASLGRGFRYVYVKDASPSPAAAANLGASEARGRYLGMLIDGARMVTPGMLSTALDCLRGFPRCVVGSLGFHLGPDSQIRAHLHGYDQHREDELLAGIGWPRDGYRLFEIAALAESSLQGWFGPMNESNCFFMPASLFDELGGYDVAFDEPGGGLLNLDFWGRACRRPDSRLITLAGEASFHQFHGGAATSLSGAKLSAKLEAWMGQYTRIRGHEFEPPQRRAQLFGEIPAQALRWIRESCDRAIAYEALAERGAVAPEDEAAPPSSRAK